MNRHADRLINLADTLAKRTRNGDLRWRRDGDGWAATVADGFRPVTVHLELIDGDRADRRGWRCWRLDVSVGNDRISLDTGHGIARPGRSVYRDICTVLDRLERDVAPRDNLSVLDHL